MTIAAGLVCSDGVVLCADTELTSTYKKQGRKLWLYTEGALSVAVTGAGDYVLLKLSSELIGRSMKGLEFDGVISAVDSIVARIHETHIDKAPQWQVESGYNLSLLVAVQRPGEVRLFESERTGVAVVPDGYSAKGAAEAVANTIGSAMFSSAMSVAWGQVFAAYMIQQSKAFGANAGGDTNIVVLTRDEPARELDRNKVQLFEDAGTWLHEAIGGVLMALTDQKGVDLKASIRELAKAVDTVRLNLGIDRISGRLERRASYLAANPAATRDPESSTDDESSLPPSQE